MPVFDTGYYGKNLSPLIDAWAKHYEAKGCHPIKARDIARKRARKKSTWPPTA